ncbi:MAG: hypothetical protein LBK67_07605 [Coriobacteriales bacterium]|jgi:hypothetical protein|nr:hypothetical protein [Coriobacteriales bacterium]
MEHPQTVGDGHIRSIIPRDDKMKTFKVWKSKQAEFLLSLGIRQDKETPVITNEIGGWHEPAGFSSWWRRFCKSNGFEDLKFPETYPRNIAYR